MYKRLEGHFGLIYKVLNIQNNKIYIGQTVQNFKYYKVYILNQTKKPINRKFFNAIRKYGWDNFKWEILGYCESREELDESEIECIEFFQSRNDLYGYNMTKGGKGVSGLIYTEEHCRHISEGHKDLVVPEEVRSKISVSMLGINVGKIHSEEQNKNHSKIMKNKKQSQEHIKKRVEVKKRNKELKKLCLTQIAQLVLLIHKEI